MASKLGVLSRRGTRPPSRGRPWIARGGYQAGEADMQRYFNVSAPSVHNMVMTLEKRRLIRRTPGVGRLIGS